MARHLPVTDSASSRVSRALRKAASGEFSGFTLAELIVVISILAILATVGFLALSGYSEDAKDAVVATNVRSVRVAIESESAVTGNSPRYYVVHDPASALSGAFVYVDGNPVALTGGNSDEPGTNYSAGNPDYGKLKLDPEKFRTSSSGLPENALASALSPFAGSEAAYDASDISVGAVEIASVVGGKPRSGGYFQVAGVVPSTGKVTVEGNYPSSSGSVSGLIRNPTPGSSATGALTDGAVVPTEGNGGASSSAPSAPEGCGGTVSDPNAHSTATSQSASASWARSATAGACTWDCNSGYGWDAGTSSCKASVTGTCGTAAKSYANSASSYGSDTFCALGDGVANPASPAFPAAGASATWTCGGSFGGASSVTCTASREAAPVVCNA